MCVGLVWLSILFLAILRDVSCIYSTFKTLVHWPDRETLYGTMPQCFKESFGSSISVIIDCFEVFIESPTNLCSNAECWSNYKHHKSAKSMIAISPQGSVVFISDSWCGRTSDKYITENSKFLDHIEPGDIVLADRGFLIEETLHLLGANLKMPAFTKGIYIFYVNIYIV